MSSPVEERDPAAPGDTLARVVVAFLVAVIVVGLVVAVVLVIKDRKGTTSQPAGPSSVSTTESPSSAGTSPTSPPGAATAPAADVSHLAATVAPWVVELTIKRTGGVADAGTGILLTADGQFLARDQTIDNALSISGSVGSADGQHTFAAIVLGHDNLRDVALLQLQGASGLQTPPFAPGATVTPGDPVVAVGHPPAGETAASLMPGIVLALDQRTPATDPDAESRSLRGLIQIYALIQPADLGGPVIDRAGKVIGMDIAGPGLQTPAAVPVAYVIPIGTALLAADEIRQGATQ